MIPVMILPKRSGDTLSALEGIPEVVDWNWLACTFCFLPTLYLATHFRRANPGERHVSVCRQMSE